MKFLLTLAIIFSSLFAFSQAPSPDQIYSGAITSSGVLSTVYANKLFRYGVGIKATVSGSVGSPNASLQVSMDGVNYAAIPVKSAGDVSSSATISTSGTYYLYSEGLATNYIRVLYQNVTGGGSLVIQQISKVHGPNY